MTGQTLELDGNGFVDVAIRHGLLQQHHVEKILQHARQANVQPSDAALTLSMLELYEVDAINLLCYPDELAPGYVLTGLIGCGAGGMVFRARQLALGRDVALKTINLRSHNASKTAQPRMQREAHAIARLHHPHIVTAYDSGFHQGRFCIAMELVEGETLADFIKRQSPVPEEMTWRIVRQVASALDHANDAGIIHRDIKPANLLLGNPPRGMDAVPGVPFVKVADFGLAFESEVDDVSQITATGATLGTPAYVAPEQLHDTHVDARADIYSLGATVYHMLTGMPPCADRSPMRTIMQKTIGDDRWRDSIPENLSEPTVALFRDMTETSTTDRIGDYRELISRIDELLTGSVERPVERSATSTHQSRLATRSTSTTTVPAAATIDLRPVRRVSTIPILVMACVVVGSAIAWIMGGRMLNTATNAETDNIAANRMDRNITGPDITDVTTTRQWHVNGFPQPLFNGNSVPLFRQSGIWSPGVAEDGSRVLIGQEGSLMNIPLARDGATSRHVRLRVGLAVTSDTEVEFVLMNAPDNRTLGVLIIQNKTAQLKVSGDGESDREASLVSLPAASEETVFQQVVFQRELNSISVHVNGQIIGRIPSDANAIESVQLKCIKNATSFADLDIVSISSKPETSR